MSFRTKTTRTFEIIKEFGEKSLAQLANLTNSSKTSVHRQIQKINNRSSALGASFFETAEGCKWLTRLVIAALLVFGLQANVGAERLSLFFTLINIACFMGLSSTSVSRLKKQMVGLLEEYEKQLLPKIKELSKTKDLMAGADETFFEQLLILVFMDLPSGFIFLEKQDTKRTFLNWRKHTESLVNKFKNMLCLVSDRAKALIKLSKEYGCESIADLFHMQMAVVRLLRFSFNNKLRFLNKQERELKKALENSIETTKIQNIEDQLWQVNEKRVVIEESQKKYRQELHNISTAVHPFTLALEIQPGKQVSKKLNNSLMSLRTIVSDCKISDKKSLLNKFEKQIQSMSNLTDLWWQWVDCDLLNMRCDDETKEWIKKYLLPWVYWEQQINKSKSSKSLRELYVSVHNSSEKKLGKNSLTTNELVSKWIDWAKYICSKYQRTTSAIEGRNGFLSECNHNLRGMTESQLKSQTIIHNFWVKRNDGTTAVERLFGFKPPNLFEWLVKNMEELPLPRQYHKNKKVIGFSKMPIPTVA
jgi:hypothetical protein